MDTPRIARLDSRAVIAVTGPDARSFLNGLLSQEIETLARGELRFAGLLSPQGRLLYDLFVAGVEDGVLLDVAAERRDAIVMRLTMYKLRAKVELTALDMPVSALFGFDPRDIDGFVADPRLPELGWRAYGDELEADAAEDDYDAHRLALGVPGPADWGTDKTYPIEANFDLLSGIDFKKGCFVGQETTSRMKRRGTIKNRMLPIAFDGPAPAFGTEVLAGELRAGEVLSGRDGRAMALLRLDRIEGAALTADGRPMRVETPVWVSA
ncbi:glycine cleavage system protein T [Caulobacter sp. Root1455]|uniref:CAF17-like 4Fe-4S cluster assembly/insertion protein YgfZ n=1 Tax=Caulobacter sp. Root1455 TaxID=1736465 RepID=UPI0006F6A74D|nr:folate-binding protein YgfZ [Caulobacter sp. Root1455]KQZ06307.1 glycine cleavage system protein T [Caulobacter sp. Root1455]